MLEVLLSTKPVLAILLTFLCGIAIYLIPQQRIRISFSLACGSILVSLLLLIWTMIDLYENAWKVDHIPWSWFGPLSGPSAIGLGLVVDPLAVMIGIFAYICGFLVIAHSEILNEKHLNKLLSGICVSLAGVLTAWIGATLWACFIGIGISVFGGVFFLTSNWNENAGLSKLASNYLWLTCAGFLLALTGGYILAGQSVNLATYPISNWYPYIGTLIGSGFMIFGLLIIMRIFPFSDWVSVKVESTIPLKYRIFSHHFLIALSVFSVLIRFESQIRSLGMMEGLGWMSCALATLSFLTGAFQTEKSRSILFLNSGCSLISISILCFAGVDAGLSAFIGSQCGTLGLSAFFSMIGPEPKGKTAKKSPSVTWVKTGLVISAMVIVGIVGFVSSRGYLKWLMTVASDPVALVLAILVLSAMAFQCWVMVLNLLQDAKSTASSLSVFVTSYLILFLTVGALWTGSMTGGVIWMSPDQVFTSLFSIMVGTDEARGISHNLSDFSVASSGLWGLVAVTFLMSYWLRNSWYRFLTTQSKMADFFKNGFYISSLSEQVFMFLFKWVYRADEVINQKFFIETVFQKSEKLLSGSSEALNHSSVTFAKQSDELLRKGVDTPAKVLQLIQNGNVQWYLFCVLVSLLGILIHYLRV